MYENILYKDNVKELLNLTDLLTINLLYPQPEIIQAPTVT